MSLILPSHRQGLYYLEHCRVMAKDERIVYAREEGAFTKFFSIPRANTNVVLLGSGTSITQAAARMMSEDGVLLGFTGGGGTPVFLASQSEYRPTEYLQSWVSFWFDEERRLAAAKELQIARAQFLAKAFKKVPGRKPDEKLIMTAIESFANRLTMAAGTAELLGIEANFAKTLYRLWANTAGLAKFERTPGMKNLSDKFNCYLDHGNYLAYGLAATVLWVLGIPHSLPVLHGKTRRGALVFDVADVVKDATVMPIAFQSAMANQTDSAMRAKCVSWMDECNALDQLFSTVKNVCERFRC